MNPTTLTLRNMEQSNHMSGASPRTTARIAGALYLVIIFAGIFAQFFARSSLIVPGDATATAANIQASQTLFRIGFASDLVMILSDVAIALAFYVLLKPVSRSLSLLAAFFRLAQAATLSVNLLNLAFAWLLLSGADYLAVLGSDQLNALAMLFLDAHGIGYSIALVFFGLSILILGYLIVRSGYIPKVLGILLVFASAGYLIDSFSSFLLLNYADFQSIFAMIVFAPALIGELALGLWLFVKGVNAPVFEAAAHKAAS